MDKINLLIKQKAIKITSTLFNQFKKKLPRHW